MLHLLQLMSLYWHNINTQVHGWHEVSLFMLYILQIWTKVSTTVVAIQNISTAPKILYTPLIYPSFHPRSW